MKTDVHILERINEAIEMARGVVAEFTPGEVTPEWKGINDPVTAADRALDEALRKALPRGDEGWFSEETTDDLSRLGHRRLWIIDPIDGTREFVAGIPEWAISIGYVEDGHAVAGGVCNPHVILKGAGMPSYLQALLYLRASPVYQDKPDPQTVQQRNIMNDIGKIGVLGGLAAKHQHKGLAAMCVDIRCAIAKPENVLPAIGTHANLI